MKQNQQGRLSQVQFIKVIIVSMIVILISSTMIMANINEDPNCLDKDLQPNQYLELRAVSVNDIEGQKEQVEGQEKQVKQVIMELWGNNIKFKRI